MMKKCSRCGAEDGQNLKACNHGNANASNVVSFKLFGVMIDVTNGTKEEVPVKQVENVKRPESLPMRKSKSTGNLQSKASSPMRKVKSMGSLEALRKEQELAEEAYLSDDGNPQTRDRKKGMPWSEEEHRLFLAGLETLGKGDWRGISRNFVKTRTPTQVASHAQKYYIRLNATDKKKRRSSLFDMPLKESSPPQAGSPASASDETPDTSLQLSTPKDLPLRINTKVQDQASSSASGAIIQRPPASPGRPLPYGYADLMRSQYMVGYPNNDQGFPAAKFVHSLSFVPVMNYSPGTNYSRYDAVYPHNIPPIFPTRTPILAQSKPTASYLQQLIVHGQPQAPHTTTVTKKGGLEVGIGALSL